MQNTKTLRLFQLPESVIQMLYHQELTMGQVKPLISCEDKALVESIAKRIVKEKLSAREVEALMKKKPKHEKVVSHRFDYAEQLLRNKLQTKVKIEGSKIQIHFDSEDDLNRLLDLMDALED